MSPVIRIFESLKNRLACRRRSKIGQNGKEVMPNYALLPQTKYSSQKSVSDKNIYSDSQNIDRNIGQESVSNRILNLMERGSRHWQESEIEQGIACQFRALKLMISEDISLQTIKKHLITVVDAMIQCDRQSSEFRDAVRIISDLLKEEEIGETNYLYYLRGKCNQRLSIHSAALEDFNNAIAKGCEAYTCLIARSLSHKALSNPDSAISDLNQAYWLVPNSAICWHEIGGLYKPYKLHDKSIKCYQNALALDPCMVQSITAIADIFNDTDLSLAIEFYTTAIRLLWQSSQDNECIPVLLVTLLKRSICWEKLEKFDNALSDTRSMRDLFIGNGGYSTRIELRFFELFCILGYLKSAEQVYRR